MRLTPEAARHLRRQIMADAAAAGLDPAADMAETLDAMVGVLDTDPAADVVHLRREALRCGWPATCAPALAALALDRWETGR